MNRLLSYVNLSIHDLTRRSTPALCAIDFCHGLSIHDLTRRSTLCNFPILQNTNLSIHDLTRRSTIFSLQKVYRIASFNSRPHKEVDGVTFSPIAFPNAFQFTTSQGGRLASDVSLKLSLHLSIHDLTRRST